MKSRSANTKELLGRASTLGRIRAFVAEHGALTEERLLRHDRELLPAIRFHFARIRNARAAAGLPPIRTNQKWSKERIVRELRAIHEAGGSTKRRDLLATGRGDLESAVTSYFGTIGRARAAARIPTPPRVRYPSETWDAERVLAEIICRHESGESIACSKVPPNLEQAACRYLGSWRAAVEAAGFDYARVRLVRAPYTRSEIVTLLRELARRRPKATLNDLHRHHAWGAMVRYFGSVHGALRAAEIEHWPKQQAEAWNAKRVVEELRELHRTGEPRSDRVTVAATRYFGSVRSARQAAGLPVLNAWTSESVLAELRARAARGDHRVDHGLGSACQKHFGGIVAARRAAGVLGPAPSRQWTKEEVVEMLRAQAERGVIAIDGPLRQACYRHFRGLAAARRAAGFDAIVAKWPRELLVRAIAGRPTTLRLPAISRACVRHFGTIRAALPELGIALAETAWTKPLILQELRGRGARPGELRPSLRRACMREFGTVEAAFTVAGVPFSKGRDWSADDLLRAARARRRLGGSMPPAIKRRFTRAFGTSWAEIERTCARLLAPFENWTVEAVLDGLRDTVRAGQPPSRALARAAAHYFGDFSNARHIAGVPEARRRWSRAIVIDRLREHQHAGGRGLSAELAIACRHYFGTVASARRALAKQAPWPR